MSRLLSLLALALVAAALVLIVTGGASPYVVRAEFADADGLRANFAVREQGVVVGNVASVSVTPRFTAIVTLDLTRNAAPIGAGASVSIEPSNLLGEKYVEISPGDLQRPQRSGTLIPIGRTSVGVDLDQVLDAFNPDTRQATSVFLAEEGNALLGRGGDLASLLARLPGSLQAAGELLQGLGQDDAALGRLVDETDQILQTATPQRAALGRLVSSADGAFATLASRGQALAGTVAAAPGAIAQLRQTLVALQSAARPLGPAAAGLRATAPSLTRALDAVPAFAAAARPAVDAVAGAAPALRQLGAEGSPVLTALRPAAADLNRTAVALTPTVSLLNEKIGQLLDVAQGWARAISDRDGVGHIYRIEVVVPNTTFASLFGLPTPPLPARAASPQSASPASASPTAAVSPAPTHPVTAAAPPATRTAPSTPLLQLPKLPLLGTTGGTGSSSNPLAALLHYLLSK